MEGDGSHSVASRNNTISIHTLRMEGDDVEYKTVNVPYISIHTLRMEGDREKLFYLAIRGISIHTLRMEGDDDRSTNKPEDKNISIHTLRMEGDSPWPVRAWASSAFQSTPSAWRVTVMSAAPRVVISPYFNPHPPHGG